MVSFINEKVVIFIYWATIVHYRFISIAFICLSDSPSKTATGTIAIQVEDSNDHCPELTTTDQTMCFEDNVIYVTAIDKDEFPNAAPFDFTVIQGSSDGDWTVEPLNG